jgi:1,6-anhydro-N-acetylmuramate kinase
MLASFPNGDGRHSRKERIMIFHLDTVAAVRFQENRIALAKAAHVHNFTAENGFAPKETRRSGSPARTAGISTFLVRLFHRETTRSGDVRPATNA